MAHGPYPALAGALLTGFGCSMVFPAMRGEVAKLVPPHLCGTTFGGFADFQDLAYAVTGPAVGLLADRSSYTSAFLIGGIAATFALGIVISVHKRAGIAV